MEGFAIVLDEDALDIVEAWQAAKEKREEAAQIEKGLAEQIKLLMGTFAEARLPDGSTLTLTDVEKEAYVVPPVAYRMLKFKPAKRRARG